MQPTSDTRAAKILVVDDNEANRALAQSTLEDEGYTVLLASRGEECLAMFEHEAPDCVVLDIRMPGMDGFAVCERLRAMPQGADTPVLFFTALRDVDTFDHALRVGGDDFLTKPVRPTELVVRVHSALTLRRLRGEVREHYDLLKNQRDSLLRLQLQKERLMAFVVHDLKNPVHSMDLNAQFLLRDKTIPAEARECATQIRNDARQLTRMIMNLLDLAKADEGQLQPQRKDVELRPLVDEILADLAVTAQNRKVTLQGSIEADRTCADPDLLRRTLTNLIENAIRYAPPTTGVRVSAMRDGNAVELRIADAGNGIPPEMREKVFDPFVQAEQGDQSVARSGRGLGLTFCKRAVEAHGGRIWIEDGAPGAVFCVRLHDAG
jgi:two-component system sensor histidine kinase/response regulator